MKKFWFPLIVLLCVVSTTFGQDTHGAQVQNAQPANPNAPKIQWVTFEQAFEMQQKEPRKILVDVYTDWCGWCKVMDKNTFMHPAIVDFVNKYYYAIKFNAEKDQEINIGGRKWNFIKQGEGGVHELAVALLQNKLAYPTVVFLDERMNMIQPIQSYMEPQMFHQLITYFFGNFNKLEPFDKYQAGSYTKLYGTPPSQPQAQQPGQGGK